MRKLIWIMLFLTLVGCSNIKRSDYGVYPTDEATCAAPEIIKGVAVYPRDDFNADEVANKYLPYGVASMNAYEYKASDGKIYESLGEYSRFVLEDYDPSWVRQPRIVKPAGLVLDYYFKDNDPAIFQVLIAFRGTELTFADWYSNFSWVTQLVPVKNQYDYARDAVAEIRSVALSRASGRKISYIATGHSLGGGLAEHAANAFPCTSAVVFDTSFVVNRFRLAEPYNPEVVHVYDKNDELTAVKRFLFSDAESKTYKRYGINPVAKGVLQHSIERLVVGMARTVAICQISPNTGCQSADKRATMLYCESRYASEESHDPVCKRDEAD